MTLTDTQIERYSRQIILPEIGGRGQERLLRSRVTLCGVGPLADAVLPYLAGAGIGNLLFRPVAGDDASAATKLAERAVQINPDVRAEVGAPMAAVFVGNTSFRDLMCETSGRPESVLSLTRAARIARAPLVAAAVAGSWGWMSTGRTYGPEPGCVFCGWLDAGKGNPSEGPGPLTPTAVGAVAALVTTAVLEAQLGLDRGQAARWLRYDAETVTLEEHAITPRDDCPVCSNHAGESTCHPTLDS